MRAEMKLRLGTQAPEGYREIRREDTLFPAQSAARTTTKLLFFSIREGGREGIQRIDAKGEGLALEEYGPVLPAGGSGITVVHLARQQKVITAEHTGDLRVGEVKAATAN